MAKSGDNDSSIFNIYGRTFAILKENPTIWIIFLLVGILDAIALTSLYMSPSKPFSAILAPLIRTFYGEVYLHYPDNLVLLPKIYGHAHFVILSTAGVVLSGVVIKKVERFQFQEKVATLTALSPVLQKYFKILAAWVIAWFSFKALSDNLLPLLGSVLWIQIFAGFTVALLTQALFAFFIPEIIIQDHGFFKSLKQAFMLGLKNLVKTASLIALPIVVLVVLSMAKAFAPLYVQFNPEIILWILGVGIVITVVVDLFVTTTTTLLYLKVRN